MISHETLIHVLGVVYVHAKTSDAGDLYMTSFAEPYQENLAIENWFEKRWFNKHKVRLQGTSTVYKLSTKEVNSKSLDLVVKYCRVGEEVPLNTHTLQEFCNAEFNSPWEEFALNDDLRGGHYGPKEVSVHIQLPLAIYVPPEKMQLWQSGRSRSKINRIRAKHPGIDLDILRQYILIYKWIEGESLIEVFQQINVNNTELKHHVKSMNNKVIEDLRIKGFYVADMKPEHIIISEADTAFIKDIVQAQKTNVSKEQIDFLSHLVNDGKYSLVDYELLMRTPEHEDEVKYSRRHSYLDDQRDRFKPSPIPGYLTHMEIFGVPYIYGHAESTGGSLWVVGNNAHLFDYFLPERWRKTTSIQLSDTKEVFYTITKDNIHLVWKISRVGELPSDTDIGECDPRIMRCGINSPFEKFAIAKELNELGFHTAYIRAIYMTGTIKVEASSDYRKYEKHKDILDPEGIPVLQENHNYISIYGYYNGTDSWVAEHEDALFTPIDLSKALSKEILDELQCQRLLDNLKNKLKNVGYDASLLKSNDLLLAMGNDSMLMKNYSGEPVVIICNFEQIWKIS